MGAMISEDATGEALFIWTDDLSVGIEEIDEQHKVLINLINELYRGIMEKHGSDVTIAVLEKLVEYTRIHFALEESLMRMLHYPNYEDHKKHHEMLLDQVNELVTKVKSGHHVTFELLHFLKNWLSKHIMEEDMVYAPFFLESGVAANHKKRSWLGRIFHK